MKIAEVVKECRAAAKKSGLSFKKAEINRHSNERFYCFADLKTGKSILVDTLGACYDNVCSGYIDTYNKETGKFDWTENN